ncbi:hypothetical protein HGI47_00535 [Novosphingobium sp. ERN07]|uniref:hypothetical protein n=1 Tax=Novosphingobium sp. ERN07 TaxID=2726187 RepID=UPI001456E10E|nr:hypothetical protein [Novosphingobium sp. ERN07]NLR69359.1 hypothetical protein [Novosphingobium sp. ERN07]
MTVTKRKPKPITAHPMFPVVTALWFAAFLSLGSFAVAPALLEGPVVALGIPEILPAAQPPLGFTVRALVAIVMMGVGGLIGYVIGRRLASAKQEVPVRARAFGRAEAANAPVVQPSNVKSANHRRPLNPIEDLGEPSVVGEFTLTDELPADGAAPFAEPTPAIVETAHLPWDDDFDFDQPAADQDPAHGEKGAEDPLALDLLFGDAEVVAHESVADEQEGYAYQQFAAPAGTAAVEAVADDAPATEQSACEEAPAPSAPLVKTPLLQAPAAAALPLARTPLDDLGLVQLTERLALAISRRSARAAAAPQAPVAPYAVPAAEPFVSSSAASEIAPVDAPEEAPSFAIAAPTPAPAIARFHSAQTEVEAPLQASELSTERVVQLRPAALQPFEPEADAFDEDDVPGLDRFLRVPASVQAFEPAVDPESSDALDTDALDDEVAVWDEGEDTTEVIEERYPSLLDMGSGSHRAQALRLSHDDDDDSDVEIDDLEPVVVFPGQSSPLQSAPRPFDGPAASAASVTAPAVSAPSSIIAVAGSPLAAPGRAAPSSPVDPLADTASATAGVVADAEEADRALRAALATLQRMTAQG